MEKQIFKHIKYWLLAITLATSTFFAYYRYLSTNPFDMPNKLMVFCYFLFFLLAIVFFHKNEINVKKIWHGIFIFGIPLLNLLLLLKFGLPKYAYMFAESVNELQIFIITLIGILFVRSSVLLSVLNRYYFIVFLFGAYYTIANIYGEMERNQFLNENTWGLFLAPFLIYLFISNSKFILRLLIYIFGALLLYFSGAHTTLVGFVVLPLFMFIFNKTKKPRLLYILLFFVGFLLVYIAAYINIEKITLFLTFRNLLWGHYIENVTSSFGTIIGGTGVWKVPNNLGVWHIADSGAHNTYISLFNYNGILALLFYLLFILFGIRNKSGKFTVSDGVLFLAITFQFAESNSPIFTYIFPSVIFLLNILINNESENGKE